MSTVESAPSSARSGTSMMEVQLAILSPFLRREMKDKMCRIDPKLFFDHVLQIDEMEREIWSGTHRDLWTSDEYLRLLSNYEQVVSAHGEGGYYAPWACLVNHFIERFATKEGKTADVSYLPMGSTLIRGRRANLKPHCVLCPKGTTTTTVNWTNVLIPCEFETGTQEHEAGPGAESNVDAEERIVEDAAIITSTLSSSLSLTPHLQLSSYVSEALSVLGIRPFIFGWVIKDYEAQLWYFDRIGAICTTLDLRQNPSHFALAVVKLALGPRDKLGFDTTIQLPTGVSHPVQSLTRSFMTLQGAAYPILGLVYCQYGIVGRATVVYKVWIGRGPADVAVLKVSYPPSTRRSEADVYSRAHKYEIKGVLRVVATKDFGAISETHGAFRKTVDMPSGISVEDRVYRALVLEPYCESLSALTNLQEFMLCFMDVVECHYKLFKEARILHRDISVGNLMYAVVTPGEPRQSGTSGAIESRPVDWSQAIPDNPIHGDKETASQNENTQEAGKEDNSIALKKSSRKVRGYLSDFDLSVIREQDPRPTSDHRAGTTPFIALELLQGFNMNESTTHVYRHHLESFFYVLIWISSRYHLGPLKRDHDRPFEEWQRGTMQSIVAEKVNFYRGATKLTTDLSAQFAPLLDVWIRPLFQIFHQLQHTLETRRGGPYDVKINLEDSDDWEELVTFDSVNKVLQQGYKELSIEYNWED